MHAHKNKILKSMGNNNSKIQTNVFILKTTYKVMHLFYKQREKVCYLDVFCYKAII